MIFFYVFLCISELMLPTLIQRHDKYHFIFDPVKKQETVLQAVKCYILRSY